MDKKDLHRHARKILRRLTEPQATLIVSPSVGKAVVFRKLEDGTLRQTHPTTIEVVNAIASQGWIVGAASGSVARYEITPLGRCHLKHLLSNDSKRRRVDRQARGLSSPFVTSLRVT